MKRTLATILTVVTVLGSSFTVFAAPETMPDGTVFDAEYYAQTYPDVVNLLGTDKEILYNHYVTNGMQEGRLPYASDAEISTENNLTPSVAKITGTTPIEVLSYLGDLPEFMLTDSRPIRVQNTALKSKPITISNTDYVYDTYGNLIMLGDSPYFSCDSEGRIIKCENFMTTKQGWELKYDEQGKLIRFASDAFIYDEQGLLTKITSSSDSSKIYGEFGYNDQGKVIWYTRYTTTRYDYSYDEQGKLTKITRSSNTDNKSRVMEQTFNYDASGKIIGENIYFDGVLYHQREYIY